MGAIDLKSMEQFIKTAKLPASAGKLANQAAAANADPSVVQFFKDMDDDLVLPNQQEVMTRAEEVSILLEEEKTAPPEEPRSREELI